MRPTKDITAGNVLFILYERIVALGGRPEDGGDGELGAAAARMRQEFQRRTGAFGPEDPWFEARSRAFWDDALTTQGFAELAAPKLEREAVARRLGRAHRGLFTVEERFERAGSTSDLGGARVVDVWSGAEFFVDVLDEAQRVVLDHAEGLIDARVVAPVEDGPLYILPGAFHHAPEAGDAARDVLAAARERGMSTGAALDALLRMELVFRSSSRVKAAFAYRVSSLGPPR
jgi:hypothetical protein